MGVFRARPAHSPGVEKHRRHHDSDPLDLDRPPLAVPSPGFPRRFSIPAEVIVKKETANRLAARRAVLGAWLAAHLGVVPLERLLAFGFSRSTVYRMVDRGELEILLPGVFKGSQWPTGREQWMVAACMRNDGVAISFMTAAQLWRFRHLPKDALVHLLVPHNCSTLLRGDFDGYVIHRSRRIDPVDLVHRTDGIRLTSPTRTALDIADVVLDSVAGSILEQLINDGRGTLATHASTLARLGHPRRPGTKTMSRVIASRPNWRAAMQSDLEVKVLAEIARQGLPAPELQFPLTLPDGRRIRLDFAWPEFREALEVDHPFWHAGDVESHSDKHRDRKSAMIGWHTNRITDFDVRGGLCEAVADVGCILGIAKRRAGDPSCLPGWNGSPPWS